MNIKSKPHIAIIDDEFELLSLYKKIFDRTAVLDCFLTPDEFIKHYQSNKNYKPNLIISDYAMPEMSGQEMIVALQKLNFDLPPVILISGNLDKSRTIAAANIGISRIVEKPFAHNELLEIADELITRDHFKTVHQELHHVMQMMHEVFSVFRIICKDEFLFTGSNRVLLEGSGPVRIATTLEEGMLELDKRFAALKEAEQILQEKAAQKKAAA